MGVDAGIFAFKAKKYFWFDRAYNVDGANYNDELVSDEELHRAEQIKFRMYQPDRERQHVEAQDALYLADLSRRCWLAGEEDQRYRANWCEDIRKFVELFPNDVFSIKSDHGSEWPDCVDEYGEIKFD